MLCLGLILLRKQWPHDEVERLERITEEMAPFTALLRYAQSQSDLQHFFDALKPLYQMATADVTQVFMQVFSLVLQILSKSSHRAAACKAGRTLIKDHIKFFYRLLSSGHNAVVSPTLDLLTTVASIDGSLNELLFGSFDFGLKNLTKFAFMRKKSLAQGERRDIRSAYVHFILSFVEHGNMATKQSLAKLQNLIGPIFAGLPDDQPALIQHVLKTVREGILYNEKKSKALTIAFVYASSLAKIAKLYESDHEDVVEEADSFLRMICTSSEHGLAFKSTPPEDLKISEVVPLKNKIILDFLLTINPLECLRKQDLCLQIVKYCPDIFSHYWSKATFSFDPEPSARYLNLVSYLLKMLQGIPVLASPYLHVSNVLPKAMNSINLSRSLSHSNSLVSYTGSLLLYAIVSRVKSLLENFEWKVQYADDKTSCWEERNKFLEQLASRLPQMRTLKQTIEQHLKTKKNAVASSLIIENLAKISSVYSEIFVYNVGVVVPVLMFPFNYDLDSLTPESKVAIWQSVIKTGSYKMEDSLLLMDSIGEDLNLQELLVTSILNRSGFLTSQKELNFLKNEFGHCGISIKQIIEVVLEMIRKRFAPKINGHSPIIGELGLFEQYETFSNASKPSIFRFDELDLKLIEKESLLHDDKPQQFDEIIDSPSLIALNQDEIISEIFSLVRLEKVNKKLNASDFTPFCPVPDNIDLPSVSKLLLQSYDFSAWLQFMAKVLSGPSEKLDFRIFVETGIIGFAIHGLASQDKKVWLGSHHVLKLFYSRLVETATFRERREIILIFDCLKNSIKEDTRLPEVIAIFFRESIQVLLRPAHFMYSKIMEFFLANHSLDLLRIPLLTECLCSSSEFMVKEQIWMLMILLNSTKPSISFSDIYQYNHVVDMIGTLLQLPILDLEIERLCSKLLIKIFKSDAGFTDVCHGVDTWIATLPESRRHTLEPLKNLFI